MPSSISRRSLVAGAAWAVPTVALAVPAPAMAASAAESYVVATSPLGIRTCGDPGDGSIQYDGYRIDLGAPEVLNGPSAANPDVLSSATTVTTSDLRLVIGLPLDAMDPTLIQNPFTLDLPDLWVLESADAAGLPGYVVYTFRYIGDPLTIETTDELAGSDYLFGASIAGNPTACPESTDFRAGYTGSFAAANGGAVIVPDPLDGEPWEFRGPRG